MNYFFGFRLFLTNLIICLCLGSLVLAPIPGVPGQLGLELFELENGNFDALDPVEGDDDLDLIAAIGARHANLGLSKPRAFYLDSQSALLSVISPPPNLYN